MAGLTSTDTQALQRYLSERRKTLRGILRAVLITGLRDEHRVLGEDVHDTGEESFAELTLGVDLAAHARELQELRDIDAALKRIDVHTFGACVDCGTEIGLARLSIHPTAKRCLACQQKHENNRSGGVDMSPSL
jgi:DnaK suppressor protein